MGKSPSLVEKGWNLLFPVDHLKKTLLTIHPTAKDFHYMENAVEVRLTEDFSRKHPVFPVSFIRPYFQTGEDTLPSRNKTYTPQYIVQLEDSPGPVNNIIKARKLRLNGRDQRQYLLRFKDQTADKDKLLAEDAIPYDKLQLRRLRASRRAEQSH
ncbi:hypothetical protein O181_054968 [Austropuccinia psidii MF-1]|uniref:Uncharacterized protein n=1 Tax=Austropuccinia psidii MF-1 TaxID=1389203 RepID=A0A9Q3E728_9BASI|nr:hypothetical protein [Austropuccinia psidii MF-1]